MANQSLDEKNLFQVACSLESPQARRNYLQKICGHQPELLQRVLRLLEVYAESPSFLEAPASADAPTLLSPKTTPIAAPASGEWIGPYKLLEQIGEGGMGVVYVAEQREPVRRKVAIKVIKPGMDTRQVVARFEAERQALALMNHPHIAKVLDAGATPDGRPYFVMELVRGVPITEFCDAHQYDTRQRLVLFVAVCRAVQHAHLTGVIHRDLKPSNVLVELHDVTAQPKIIDFGVAKATNQQLTDSTLHTGHLQMVGTPLYMSPEQAQLNALDVDTRSDVYSLGVLLYELLTGNTPFDGDSLECVGFDEMRRMIREVDPPRPSQRVSTLNAAAQSTVAQRRRLGGDQLRRSLYGELDWIVMKSLEKERARRYETASALATDIERFMRDEPVEACPPSFIYRMRKLVRRRAAAVITALTIALALLIGGGISLWQAGEASRAKAVAVQERQDAELNLELAREAIDKLLRQLEDETIPASPRFDDVRGALLNEIEEFYRRLLAQTGDTPAVQFSMARAWRRIGEVDYDLGDAGAVPAYENAFTILEALIARHPTDPKYMTELAEGCQSLAQWDVHNRGDFSLAPRLLKRARDLRLTLARLEPNQPDHPFQAMVLQAELDRVQGKSDNEVWHRQRVAFAREVVARHPKSLVYRAYLASALDSAAHFLEVHGGQAEEIAKMHDDRVKLLEDCLCEGGKERPYRIYLASTLQSKANFLTGHGEHTEAELLFRQALTHYDDLFRRLMLGHHDEAMRALCRIQFGESLEKRDRLPEAEQAYRVAMGDLSHGAWGQRWNALLCLAEVLLLQGRVESAREVLEQYIVAARREEPDASNAPNVLERWRADVVFAELLRQEAAGEANISLPIAWANLKIPAWKDAASAEFELMDRLKTLFPKDHSAFPRTCVALALEAVELLDRMPRDAAKSAGAYNALAWWLTTSPDPQKCKPDLAVDLATKAVELDPSLGAAWNTLGAAHFRAGDDTVAIEVTSKSVEFRSGGDAFDFYVLAMAHWRTGNKQEARVWYDKGVAWTKKHGQVAGELGRFHAEATKLLGIDAARPDPTKL